MRKIHVYINEIPELTGTVYSPRDEVLSLLFDIEEPVLNEFYPGVRPPFRPFQLVKNVENADIALLILTENDIPSIKEIYYTLYVKGTPVFLLALADTTGDVAFRSMVFGRHPHFVIGPQARHPMDLKEYLSDFLGRELKKKFVLRFSQMDQESLKQGYLRDWSCFIEPPEFERVGDILKRYHFVVLYGPSNCGKSCLARNMLKLYEQQGYHLNEILTPNFTPHMFINALRSPDRVITLFDNDAYSFEWEWQVSSGILNLFLATMEKWADEAHPVIFVFSGKKMRRLLDQLKVKGWPGLAEKLVAVSPFHLSAERVDQVVEKHLHYYQVASAHHPELLAFFKDIYSPDITPSLIFYTLRFAILPQGPNSSERLKNQRKNNLYNPKRLFEMYLQSSSRKEILILYVLLATEMELDRSHFEALIKEIYHFSLFMEGNIVDFTPHQHQWIEHHFNDLSGAIFRRYRSDDEEHLVFSHRLFRSSVSRFFKQHASQKFHKIIAEAIVEYLMDMSSFQGRFFALRFLLFHFRSFSEEYRKKIFYHFVRERDHGDQSFIIQLLYQVYYLIGKEGLATLAYFSQSEDQSLREEHAWAFGIFYAQTHRYLELQLKAVLSDKSEKVLYSFIQSVALGIDQLAPQRKQYLLEYIGGASNAVKSGFLFGVVHNEVSLDETEKDLLQTLLEQEWAGKDEALARAFRYLPVSTLISTCASQFSTLTRSRSGFVRALVANSFAGRLAAFPPHLVQTLFDLCHDPSPLVRKEVASILIRNYSFGPDKVFGLLRQMIEDKRPYLRASVSSVIIESFSVFSAEQQAQFLQHFLQNETIEGIKKSIIELIGSHFHLIKEATEDQFFRSIEWNDPQTRINIAEQILTYYEQLKESSRDLLLRLVRDPDDRIRTKVVSTLAVHCAKIPAARLGEIFVILSNDDSEFIRSQVAENLATLGGCLDQAELSRTIHRMLEDTELVRTNLAKALLSDQSMFEQFYETVLPKLEKDFSKQVRLALLQKIRQLKGRLPEIQLVRILEASARDTSSEVRFETIRTIIDLAITFSDEVRERLLPLLTGLESESGAMLNRELEMAAEIQGNLLPKRLPRMKGYRFAFLFSPARVIGGDCIAFFPLGEEKLGIAMADISGKGIPAALLMANFHAQLSSQITIDPDPTSVADRLNTLFRETTQANRFVSFVYGILDRTEATFTYVNAGHNYPMIYSAAAGLTRLDVGGPVLGVFEKVQFLSETVNLPLDSTMIMFTDGIPESRNDTDTEFGEQKLVDLLVKNHHLLPKQLIDLIEHDLHEFSNVLVPHDDISLIVVQRV